MRKTTTNRIAKIGTNIPLAFVINVNILFSIEYRLLAERCKLIVNYHLMRYSIIFISFFITKLAFGQEQKIAGTYGNTMPEIKVKFYPDFTFEYVTKEQHPTFYRWEDFSEKGKWKLSGDTIILNPDLTKKIYVESVFKEEQEPGNSNLLLTFNHIKRYFDADGNILKTDTFQIDRLDYTFNELKKKKLTRVAPHLTTRCAFAGYIPKQIITTDRTISVQRPTKTITSIFIGCYELQGTKEFIITNPNSNHFILNVYSNYYQDGQIRQMKFLIKNDKNIYTRQKANGNFDKDNMWIATDAKLKRMKGGN